VLSFIYTLCSSRCYKLEHKWCQLLLSWVWHREYQDLILGKCWLFYGHIQASMTNCIISVSRFFVGDTISTMWRVLHVASLFNPEYCLDLLALHNYTVGCKWPDSCECRGGDLLHWYQSMDWLKGHGVSLIHSEWTCVSVGVFVSEIFWNSISRCFKK